MLKPDLRIIFMGTPIFAVEILNSLLDNKCDVISVVTAPDKPAGRKQKIQHSPVKILAQKKRIPILQPHNLKAPLFIEQLKKINADVFIVVAFRMLPKIVWSLAPKGTFNLHASLLPNYRGAAPIQWAIINQEKKTGVTTFWINEKIDSGKIIAQKEIKITSDETAGTLHNKLIDIGKVIVLETLFKIQKKLNGIPQKLIGNEKIAPKINTLTCKINWQKNLDEIDALIRALSPYPAAWTIIKNNNKTLRVKIHKAKTNYQKHNYKPLKVKTEKDKLWIAHKQGMLQCLQMQLPNKKVLTTREILNGFTFYEDAEIFEKK